MPEIALIDGDIITHRVGFTTENDEWWIAKARCDDMLDKILVDTGVEGYELWLSDAQENNFRYEVYSLYKANRIGKPRPRHLESLKEYLIQEWNARVAHGMEADDALGIGQDEYDGTTVICSIDKDLKQIPGIHYNFVQEEWDKVDHATAIKAFYKQIIVGDTSDNVPGAYGMGPVKAGRAIDGINASDIELHRLCYGACTKLYTLALSKEWEGPWTREKEAAIHGMILLSGRLLKIKRSQNEPVWHSPFSSQMENLLSLYTLPPQVEIGPFTEPTSLVENGSSVVGGETVDTLVPQSQPL